MNRSKRGHASGSSSISSDLVFFGGFAMATIREKQIEFNEALAIAVTQWQHVELELYRIFLWCMNPANAAVASASFHAVINFNTRLAMTDAAAQIAMANEQTDLETWTTLRERARKRVKRRNELVHFMTFHKALEGDMRFRLVPSIFDVNSAGSKEYGTAEITGFGRSFGQLSQRMFLFANDLFNRQQQPSP
jgi:hypothetical protein